MTVEGLTPEQLTFFNENGYLLIPNELSPSTIETLLQDTNKMLTEFPLEEHPMTKFSTGGDDGADHVGDAYFLDSGDKIRFFFEEGPLLYTLYHSTPSAEFTSQLYQPILITYIQQQMHSPQPAPFKSLNTAL